MDNVRNNATEAVQASKKWKTFIVFLILQWASFFVVLNFLTAFILALGAWGDAPVRYSKITLTLAFGLPNILALAVIFPFIKLANKHQKVYLALTTVGTSIMTLIYSIFVIWSFTGAWSLSYKLLNLFIATLLIIPWWLASWSYLRWIRRNAL